MTLHVLKNAVFEVDPKAITSKGAAEADGHPLALSQAAALLTVEGACMALFFLQVANRVLLPNYVARNDVTASIRRHWLEWMGLTAAAFFVGAIVANRAEARRYGRRVRALALLLSPFLVLCLLPGLLTIHAWDGRELEFLLTVAMTMLALLPLLRVAGGALREFVPSRTMDSWLGFWTEAGSRRESKVIARIVVFSAACFMAAYFAFYTIRVHHKVQTSLVDLGLFDNLFWNALHGAPFYAASATQRGQSYLAIHAELLLYLFLPFYAIAPRPETLLVIQAVVAAAAAIPLYFIAEKRLGPIAAGALSVAYLLYPPMHRPIFYDFHFLTLSPFFILCAALFLERRKWVLFWLFVLLSLACREDVALGMVGIGAGLAFSSYRPRTGWALAGVATLYVVLVKFGLMSHFGAPSFVKLYSELLPPEDPTFGGVLRTLASNPTYAVSKLFSSDKLIYLLQIVLPLGFVCLRAPRLWFLWFPGIFITLLSTGFPAIVQIEFQYVAHFIPYVFLAAVGFFSLGRRGGRIDLASMAALLLATFVMTSQFGALSQSNFHSGFKRVDFRWSAEDGARLRDLRKIATLIPGDASLSASEAEGAHLGARRELFPLKDDIENADYVLFSTAHLGIGRDTELVRGALEGRTYGVVAEEGEFALLQREASPGRNEALLRRLPRP